MSKEAEAPISEETLSLNAKLTKNFLIAGSYCVIFKGKIPDGELHIICLKLKRC